jgi:sugar phosphate isomerase/epimerase
MKLCVSNIAWAADQDVVALEILARHGIEAVEIAPTKYWPAPCNPSDTEIYDCKHFWSAGGVPIQAMQALLFGMPNLSIFTASVADETRKYLIHILRIGAAAGATRYVFGSPKNRDRGSLSTGEANRIAADFFRPIADTARELGVVFCIEPNPTVYQCNFMTNTAEALAVVRAVDHPGLGVHLDSGIMFLNEESVDAVVASAAPYLRHFHVSHPQLAAVTDDGPIDHAAVSRALRNNGYCGMVSVEMRGAENPADNLARLNVACEVLNRHYRN